MNSAFNESAFNMDGLKPGQWKGIHVHDVVMQLICRTTNRLVVGAPLCEYIFSSCPIMKPAHKLNPTLGKNEEFRDLNINFAVDVSMSANYINLFPSWSHPFVKSLSSSIRLRL